MASCGTPRIERLARQMCGVGHRLLGDVAVRVVMDELRQDPLDSSRRLGFELLGVARVHEPPLPARQRSQQDLVKGSARERELVAALLPVLLEKPGLDEPIDHGVEILHVAGHQLELAIRESTAEHRGHSEQFVLANGQSLDAPRHGLSNRQRQVLGELAGEPRCHPHAIDALLDPTASRRAIARARA